RQHHRGQRQPWRHLHGHDFRHDPVGHVVGARICRDLDQRHELLGGVAVYGATNAQLAVAAPRVPVTVTLPDTTCPRAGNGPGTLNTASNFSLVGSLASDCKAGNSCAALVTPT